jgi:chromosome partitioning protein
MKTIAINSIKGGTGKSTLAVLFINALASAGCQCLVIDADASNNSLSFYLNAAESLEAEQCKTIFNLFMGESVTDCAIKVNDKINLVCGDVRLNEFRSTDSLKRLKRTLPDLELAFLDTHIVFNQFEKPLTENQNAYRNQITNLFLENATFKPFINPNRISRSSVYRKYINRRNYRIDDKPETRKAYGEIKALIHSVLGISIGEAV